MTSQTSFDDEPVPPPNNNGRQWARSSDTRRQILESAEDVFVDLGYWNSNISDIVERSGSSVGSIYHHFGGKAELFTALWENYAEILGGVAIEASQAYLKENPDAEPIEAFTAGAREYCLHNYENRRGLSLFYSGDTPPGYERLRRQGNSRWLRRNARLLGLGDSVEAALMTASLTAVIAEACRIIVQAEDRDVATRVADATVVLLGRLYEPVPD